MDIEATNPEFLLDYELATYYSIKNLSPASFDNHSIYVRCRTFT